ncbi:Multiple inositol polyphosphate phosphatase [Phaffia rhodozyma]|uniref:Multiple inositol polyphosphate phosphatase n=1 Tax=Phaffia rhodozyma TaxID=264483 RepID=A0A0F7SLJ4_PHARH|nr:Multiple inositol polyphosphate phosphatase [Phaffia rhodozyma]
MLPSTPWVALGVSSVLVGSIAQARPLNSQQSAQMPFWFQPDKYKSSHPMDIHNQIDPLTHLSAISPFFLPEQAVASLPENCNLTRAALLVRHSAILANDEEWDETMKPFVDKLKKIPKSEFPQDKSHPWHFLNTWKSHISRKDLEVLSDRGKDDSYAFGKMIRSAYGSLFPPVIKKKSSSSSSSRKSTRVSYKVWSASSARDIDTSKSYIRGAFPTIQSGPDGTGDGEQVELIEVPNHEKSWERSLTPHKACDAFEKESSKKPAETWLAVYAAKTRARLSDDRLLGEKLAGRFVDMDILAMQMLCGYQTIGQGDSPLCKVFTDEEWLAVEYYFDIRYHYMIGYGNSLSPYLGRPWVRTAAHLLAGEESHLTAEADSVYITSPRSLSTSNLKRPKTRPLPIPKLPPNETHTQLLHPFFTHRESPGFASVFLNLYNRTEAQGGIGQSAGIDPPLDRIPEDRQWMTSHLVPFLGHIALEQFEYIPPKGTDANDLVKKKEKFVRCVVNGKVEIMGGCQDGIEESCKWETFINWVDERAARWGTWEEVCKAKA